MADAFSKPPFAYTYERTRPVDPDTVNVYVEILLEGPWDAISSYLTELPHLYENVTVHRIDASEEESYS